jgi:hypothetical protein
LKQYLLILLITVLSAGVVSSQTGQPTVQQRPGASFEVSEYGVDFQADLRLIVMMAALDVAGFEPATGRAPSTFRAKLRKDLANLDPDLRTRLKTFFDRNKLPAPATPADQAARYVSLALALGQPPTFDAPERSDDLPAGLLEVLDFAPLVQEFYRRSGIDEQMVGYVRAYQAEGDRLRAPTTEMVRSVLTYLHTRPITTSTDRVEVKNPNKKNAKQKVYNFKQKERRFLILPDLLAAPGTINFRIIADDYYAVVPEGTNPSSSELRRAYLQYVIDALVLRFNRDIALRREQVKQLLNERQKAGAQVSPDVFLNVSRSLVTAADARYEEARRLEILSRDTRPRLAAAKTEAERNAIAKPAQAEMKAIQDETVARLAEEYEKGGVLSFYFADQLKGIESAGFDLANFFPDMIASFDPVREAKRPSEYAETVQRALAAREARTAARRSQSELNSGSEGSGGREAPLVRDLSAIEDTLRNKDYNGAESRLREMLKDYPREPRIFFALGQTASLAASDAVDEQVRDERLNRALAQYRFAVAASSPDTDKAIMSRAFESMGRINAFMDNTAEAVKLFDEAIKLGDVRGGAYKEAVEGKKKLTQP